MARRITMYPAPHVEARVHVSDEMIKDYKECARLSEVVGRSGKDCDSCSWNDVRIGDTAICALKDLERQIGDE